ncbi:M15 family metallopeptidase [Nocardioides pacificus]
MRTGARTSRRGGSAVAVLGLVALTLVACGDKDAEPDASPTGAAESSASGGAAARPGTGDPSAAASVEPGASSSASGTPAPPSDYAMDPPGPLEDTLLPADMLVYSQEPLSDEMVDEIGALKGISEVEQLSLSQVAVEDRVLMLAAVDPASYRRFTQRESAGLQEIWDRVAGGEMAITPHLGKRLQDDAGYVQLGNDADAPQLHIGAFAPQVPQIDAVVNQRWAEAFGMKAGNAVLISTERLTSPQSVRESIEKIAGDKASVQILGPDLDISAQQTAFLTGGSVAAAVGTFSYGVIGGGRIAPDPAWVKANIRTEAVPILGNVTCHKVMLPQFRAALTEIASTPGLAAKIHPDEYAGCYYPRFIANSTSLSLHSFGIAVDLNVPGNGRGTKGEIDRTVVSIFKKWGFAWGGDWSWTDPMHFEMDRIVQAR